MLLGHFSFPSLGSLGYRGTQTFGSDHVIFSTSAFDDELKTIPTRTTAAIFCMSFDMEDILLRGTFQGIERIGGIQCGSVLVNWVYNPMPPILRVSLLR